MHLAPGWTWLSLLFILISSGPSLHLYLYFHSFQSLTFHLLCPIYATPFIHFAFVSVSFSYRSLSSFVPPFVIESVELCCYLSLLCFICTLKFGPSTLLLLIFLSQIVYSCTHCYSDLIMCCCWTVTKSEGISIILCRFVDIHTLFHYCLHLHLN